MKKEWIKSATKNKGALHKALGVASDKKISEKKLDKAVPSQYKHDAHHLLILHGRYTCIARKPRCGSCVIEDLCQFNEKTGL